MTEPLKFSPEVWDVMIDEIAARVATQFATKLMSTPMGELKVKGAEVPRDWSGLWTGPAVVANEKTEVRCINCGTLIRLEGLSHNLGHSDNTLPMPKFDGKVLYARCGPCYGLAVALKKDTR
jgi:hypothetical protein